MKDRDGRFELINDRFEMLHGMRRDEVVGKTDHDLFRRRSRTRTVANDLKVLATGICARASRRSASSEDGPRTYLSTRFPLFDSDDRQGSAVRRLHDLH